MDELSRALSASGRFTAREQTPQADLQPGEIALSVSGRPEALKIVLHGSGADVEQQLEPTACETANDVVAAFVVTVLGAPPETPTEPAAPVEAKPKPEADLAARRLQRQRLKREARAQANLNARAKLLKEHLERYSFAGSIEPYIGAVTGTLGLAAGVAIGVSGDISDRQRLFALAAVSPAIIGGFGSYALPEPYQARVASGSMFIGIGALYPLVAEDSNDTNRVIWGAELGAIVSTGVLMVGDALLGPQPVSNRTLRAHFRRLKEAEEPNEASIRNAEVDYARTKRVMNWILPVPSVIAAGINFGIALAPDTPNPQRGLAAVFAANSLLRAINLLGGVLFYKDYDDYQDSVRKLSLSPAGPEGSLGFTLSGTF